METKWKEVQGYSDVQGIMGILCAGHHGKAQWRELGVCRASWEGSVEGARGVQGILGRLRAGIDLVFYSPHRPATYIRGNFISFWTHVYQF